jgi:hypothetical protein
MKFFRQQCLQILGQLYSRSTGVHSLTNQHSADQLLLELARCEDQLKLWLSSSAENAEWFAKDPVSAMRAAEVGLPEDLLQEFALVLGSLKEKLTDAA